MSSGTPAPRRLSFQHIVYLLLIAAFSYALYRYRDQLSEIVDVLQQGVWYLVLAALLTLVLTVYNQTWLYASIYQLLALPSQRRDFLPLYLVKRFVQVAAPSGGFSGWVPFLQFARRREFSVGTVFVANLIYTILWYSTFGFFLLIGLFFLFTSHDLQWFEISAALTILATDLVMIGLLITAWVRPGLPLRIMRNTARLLQRLFALIRRPPPLSERQMTTFAADLSQGVMQMRRAGWRKMLEPVLHAFINEALHIGIFFLVALAFGVQLNFGVLVAAYSISVLFWIVSPTPGGLGFVEGTLILVLTALDVPATAAAVITLAYRGISFWLPFVLGFVALRWFSTHPKVGEPEPAIPEQDTGEVT
jgi:glycosyltransferase 2 family protein